ncbi:unnamed protein product [Amoebophrya sp. A120]|nr:unnamed protein product [Amoebophrya sp. A120]|eukprot:GSA120T00012730001.1
MLSGPDNEHELLMWTWNVCERMSPLKRRLSSVDRRASTEKSHTFLVSVFHVK